LLLNISNIGAFQLPRYRTAGGPREVGTGDAEGERQS
jgi:hypothetical protein